MGTAPTRVLTIGCSCINRFQFDFFQERHPVTEPQFVKSLFDWNIVSLVGTESVLRLAASGALLPTLRDISQYYVEWDVLLFHKQLSGVCFFHEQDIAKSFDDPAQKETLISKVTHQAAPFLHPGYPGKTHLVWSNIQPNLPDTVNNVTPWADFQLTAPHHTEISALGRRVFGADTTFTFLTHKDDVARELISRPDVQVVDLPRSNDYLGPRDLYDPMLSRTVLQTQT
ncbi:hypothetical protein [Marivita sp.]|uniref:hypothetical protein n=1 Tax=Marivita sp. TaxID=2003365 RepID=UPI003F6AD06E